MMRVYAINESSWLDLHESNSIMSGSKFYEFKGTDIQFLVT